jgi:hypothetical protein
MSEEYVNFVLFHDPNVTLHTVPLLYERLSPDSRMAMVEKLATIGYYHRHTRALLALCGPNAVSTALYALL